MRETEEQRVVREVREKTQELASLLDDFSDRLRRMRQRNREVEQEISSFESELERLRREVLEMRGAGGA
jgi:cell division septum initiation protein DivIVA